MAAPPSPPTISDLVVPQSAIHFLEVCIDNDSAHEPFFRFPPGTSPIDTRTMIRHGEREFDKHKLALLNGLAQPYDRRFQILSVRTIGDSDAAFELAVQEPGTCSLLVDSRSDILCLNFITTASFIPDNRSTTASPPRTRRGRKPPPWTINQLFVDTDPACASPTDSFYQKPSPRSTISRTPSLAGMSVSTLTDTSQPVTPASPSFPRSPSESTATLSVRESPGSSSPDSIGTLAPMPSSSSVRSTATPRTFTATEILHGISRVAIVYDPRFGAGFQCIHCGEEYASEITQDADARNSERVSGQCWPWRNQQRDEGHEFRAVLSEELESLLTDHLHNVTELWLVLGSGSAAASLDVLGMEALGTQKEPIFHGLDSKFLEIEDACGVTGTIGEMVALAQEVERWLQTDRGWRHADPNRRCRVLVPVSYSVGHRGGMVASGIRDGDNFRSPL